MKIRWTAAAAALAAALGGGWWAAARGNSAVGAVTDAVARQGVELTVYKEDFGMVRETRPVRLTAGDNQVELLEISKQLDPQSVLLRWTPQPSEGGDMARAADGGAMPQLVAHSYDLG